MLLSVIYYSSCTPARLAAPRHSSSFHAASRGPAGHPAPTNHAPRDELGSCGLECGRPAPTDGAQRTHIPPHRRPDSKLLNAAEDFHLPRHQLAQVPHLDPRRHPRSKSHALLLGQPLMEEMRVPPRAHRLHTEFLRIRL